MAAAPHLRLVPPPSPDGQAPSSPTDFEAIFRQHARYVAAIALRVLGRDDEIDDVVQDVFLAAMKELGALRSPGALKGWLATVTVRHAMRRLRRRRLRRFLRLDRGQGHEVAAPGATPEQRALLVRVYGMLDRLPVPERVAWTLRHLEGEQVDAVAQLCGCSLATAKRRIAAAHEAIERMIGDDA